MTKNVGSIDKLTRIVLGIAIIVIGVIYNSLLGAIGLVPIITALIGWCPLYPILGISTCEKSCTE